MDPIEKFIVTYAGIAAFIIGFASYIMCLVQGDSVRLTVFFLVGSLFGLASSAANIIGHRVAARKEARY